MKKKFWPKITKNWQKDFNPRAYLNEYYLKVYPEDIAVMNFVKKEANNISRSSILLEIGGGPTIYQLITIAPLVKEIHFSDFLNKNLDEVRYWIRNDKKQLFNWDKFIKVGLKIEGTKKVTKKSIEERKGIIRNKIRQLLHCDLRKKDPVGEKRRESYDILTMHYVPESITDNKRDWNRFLSNASTVLKPGGKLIITSLVGANYYKLGKKYFPATPINPFIIKETLHKIGFYKIKLKSIKTEYREAEGYKSTLLTSATKKS